MRPMDFLPAVKFGTRLAKADVLIAFIKERAALASGFKRWTESIPKDGTVWVAWPKKASKVLTDVTENHVREIALATGLVDNKVCAIDEVWSGLRLVYRLKDR